RHRHPAAADERLDPVAEELGSDPEVCGDAAHLGCTITQTPPSPAATSVGLGPTLIVATTLAVFGLIRETVPASRFAVQTLPWPAATANGPSPTLTIPTTRFVFALILTTESSPVSTTQA